MLWLVTLSSTWAYENRGATITFPHGCRALHRDVPLAHELEQSEFLQIPSPPLRQNRGTCSTTLQVCKQRVKK